MTETEDALWLPSAMEIFGTTDIEDETNGLIKRQPDQVPVYEAEGKSYTLYQLTKLLYRYDNDYPTAWTRSCDASQSGAFIAYNGFDLCSGVDADEAYAVFPGFCL